MPDHHPGSRPEESRRSWSDVLQGMQDEIAGLDPRYRVVAAALRELDAFSYSASHDLRAPLRGIDGFSLALLEEYGESLDETARGYIDRIRAATRRMAGLIDDLLALSRISRTRPVVEPVSLTGICVNLAAALRQREPDRDLRFEVAEAMEVVGDRGLLTIAIQNLLENAAKYTRHSEPAIIEIDLIPSEDGPGFQVLRVRDNGAGFDMRYQDQLFAPFRRLHSDAEFPGTGIGLATVQRVATVHGGRVWGIGAPGAGAEFFLALPAGGRDGVRESE